MSAIPPRRTPDASSVRRWLLAAGLLLGAPLAAAQAQPVAPTAPAGLEAGLQLPGVYRLPVGGFRVTALSDGTVPLDLDKLLQRATRTEIDSLLRRGYVQNPVETSINAFLIETGSRVVLVDVGAGDFFGPGYAGKLMASLAAAGVRAEQVNDILLTHLHSDHAGGLVHEGQRVFPNATVHVSKPEVDFFLDPANGAKTGTDAHYFSDAAKALKPYMDAGRVATFAGPTQIVPGITATIHPGHTPGSAFYVAESQGQRITFAGDIAHVAAVQFADPRVTITYDVDQRLAARTRETAFATLAGQRALLAEPHMQFPGLGYIRADTRGYTWVPVDYTNRAGAK